MGRDLAVRGRALDRKGEGEMSPAQELEDSVLPSLPGPLKGFLATAA